MKQKDNIFNKPIDKLFEFDDQVASVFDDMLDRSVPFYKETIKECVYYVNQYTKQNSKILDLGCSTGNTLVAISKKIDKNLKLIGIDNSDSMLNKATQKAQAFGSKIEFRNDDITKVYEDNVDVIISNYTLQFIRPIKRDALISNIYKMLNRGGAFIFSEKVITKDKKLSKEMIDRYHSFKISQGYSEFEISAKREALENVLLPYTVSENKKMIKKAGFQTFEIILKWNNFATFIAIK